RVSTPTPGRSILVTSAPKSASIIVANGPARTREKSRILSGPRADLSPASSIFEKYRLGRLWGERGGGGGGGGGGVGGAGGGGGWGGGGSGAGAAVGDASRASGGGRGGL